MPPKSDSPLTLGEQTVIYAHFMAQADQLCRYLAEHGRWPEIEVEESEPDLRAGRLVKVRRKRSPHSVSKRGAVVSVRA